MAEVGPPPHDSVNQVPPHRQLLGNLNSTHLDDSSQDDLSDDASQVQPTNADADLQDDLVGVGVSIGSGQIYMRSARTASIEKLRVLEEQNDYFANAVIDTEAGNAPGQPPTPTSDDQAGSRADHSPFITHEPLQLPSPWTAHPQPMRRNPVVRSVLGATTANARERAMSGSILGGLKKFLPELPTWDILKSIQSPLSAQPMENNHGSTQPQAVPVDVGTGKPSLERSRSKSVTLLQSPGLDGNVDSLLTPVTSARSRTRNHRSNSDNSLYLKKRPTGISTFDDTSVYAHVTDMTSSRFKAITDSLQNSTLKIPKMPTVKLNNKLSTNRDHIRLEDATRSNTEANTGEAGSIAHYTNIYNLRKAKNKQIAEYIQTPQQRAHPLLSEALSKLEGDVVLLGGYRGSVLRDAKPPHRQLWAPVKIGLNLRSVDLEVGLTREEEEQAFEKVIPSGTLSHIGPIDICRRLLKHLHKCPNTREGKLRVHDWGYDWRLSPELLSKRLIDFLEGLECNRKDIPPELRGATIIAHSLGGLLTRHAVNQRPELFAGVVYAGVPQNCVNILGPLRNGDDVLLSSRVLTAQVNFTMRTSFVLLPEEGRCFLNKHTNERYDVNFFDPQVWSEYRLSPCINPALPAETRGQQQQQHRKSIIGSMSESVIAALPSLPNVGKSSSWFGTATTNGSEAASGSTAREAVKDTVENVASEAHDLTESTETGGGGIAVEATLEPSMKRGHKPSIATAVTIAPAVAREYLERTLAEVLAFKQALAHREELQAANKYPPHAFMFGKSVPTVYGARVASREAIKYNDALDDLAFAAGDGVVLASAAQLPDGYECVKGGRIETDRGHVGLLGDLEGVGRCLSAVLEARKRGVGWMGRAKGKSNE